MILEVPGLSMVYTIKLSVAWRAEEEEKPETEDEISDREFKFVFPFFKDS